MYLQYIKSNLVYSKVRIQPNWDPRVKLTANRIDVKSYKHQEYKYKKEITKQNK